ncbi:MAG: TetR/AcrR family transcriptional regulator [Myxococcota bacterium]
MYSIHDGVIDYYDSVIIFHPSPRQSPTIDLRHEARPGAPDADTVLATARRLLIEGGPPALTVRRLADALDVSRQVVYSRFGSKAGLLDALYTDGFRRLAQVVRSIPEPGTDAHILDIAHAYREHALTTPAIYALMFDGDFTPPPPARAAAADAFDILVSAAAAWLDTPDPRDPSARTLARSLWASAHGVVSLERAGHLAEDVAARQLDEVVIRILAGSRPPRTNHQTGASSGGVTPR